jgi:hypothetical protein
VLAATITPIMSIKISNLVEYLVEGKRIECKIGEKNVTHQNSWENEIGGVSGTSDLTSVVV